MTTALLALSVLMAIVVGWLLRHTLHVTPWVEQRAGEIAHRDGALRMPAVQVGLWVFLAVATSLFALSISAYFMRMMEQDWTHLQLPRVLWLNGALLVLASIAMQWALVAGRRRQLAGVRMGLVAAGICTWAFLAGQLYAWQVLKESGHFTPANPAYAFFSLLVTLHALHLLGGLWAWARTTARAFSSVDAGQLRLSVQLCTVYWHFLLAVWAVLFTVLLRSHH